MMRTLTAYIEFDPETNLYVGFVPGIIGAHSQGETLDELHENLKEVLEMCLEENTQAVEDLPHFVGLQQIEVSV
jgi:predicted RNase H-like HicB family nuclease